MLDHIIKKKEIPLDKEEYNVFFFQMNTNEDKLYYLRSDNTIIITTENLISYFRNVQINEGLKFYTLVDRYLNYIIEYQDDYNNENERQELELLLLRFQEDAIPSIQPALLKRKAIPSIQPSLLKRKAIPSIQPSIQPSLLKRKANKNINYRSSRRGKYNYGGKKLKKKHSKKRRSKKRSMKHKRKL